jgi:hypothetical protein
MQLLKMYFLNIKMEFIVMFRYRPENRLIQILTVLELRFEVFVANQMCKECSYILPEQGNEDLT